MDIHDQAPPAPFDIAAAAAGDPDALEAAVAALARIGAQALADDAEHGSAWSVFADWAHRTGHTAQPATAATIDAWIADEGARLPAADTVDVLDAIVAVHHAAGHPDPTGGR